jgi:K+/H+ antiporter YhaU regulatory subunit KhtT
MQFISLITSAGSPGVFFEAIAFEELSDQLRGKTIAQLGIRQRAGASVIAIKKPDGDFIINPSAETVLGTYAKMIILGNRDQIEACRQLLMNPEAEEKHRQQSAG